MGVKRDGFTFAAGMLAAFRASCTSLFVIDLAQLKAAHRVRLRYAFTDLNGGDIVGLVQRHGGEAA
jgi:hypothetical protein